MLFRSLTPEQAQQRLAPVLASQQAALSAVWRDRERRVDNDGEAARLAARLQPLLRQAVQGALGGPASSAP